MLFGDIILIPPKAGNFLENFRKRRLGNTVVMDIELVEVGVQIIEEFFELLLLICRNLEDHFIFHLVLHGNFGTKPLLDKLKYLGCVFISELVVFGHL